MKLKKGETPEAYVRLLLTGIKSESKEVEAAVIEYLVDGGNQQALAAKHGALQPNMSRLLKKLGVQHGIVVEGQKFIDGSGKY